MKKQKKHKNQIMRLDREKSKIPAAEVIVCEYKKKKTSKLFP